MNIDVENMIYSSSNRHGKSASKGLGGMKDSFAKENFIKNNGKDIKEPMKAGRVKLGVLAKSNISASTPLRKAAQLEEKDLLKCSGDDFDQFVKSTTQNLAKPIEVKHYPPVEYGYNTNIKNDFDDDILIPHPRSDIIWERDEEDEAHETKEISESELEDILQWI